MGGLVGDIITTACVTIMSSAVVKALGQKETADIIKAAGVSIVGVQTIVALTPLIKGIQEFGEGIGAGIEQLGIVFDKITFWN